MDFFERFNQMSLSDQMVLFHEIAGMIQQSMVEMVNKTPFTREDARVAGVTQAYKAGEGETDLRYRWQLMAGSMVEMDMLINQIEKNGRSSR